MRRAAIVSGASRIGLMALADQPPAAKVELGDQIHQPWPVTCAKGRKARPERSRSLSACAPNVSDSRTHWAITGDERADPCRTSALSSFSPGMSDRNYWGLNPRSPPGSAPSSPDILFCCSYSSTPSFLPGHRIRGNDSSTLPSFGDIKYEAILRAQRPNFFLVKRPIMRAKCGRPIQ